MQVVLKIIKRLLKYLAVFLVLFILLMAGGLLYLRLQYPPESWQALLRSELEKRLKLKIKFTEVNYSLTGGLSVRDFELHDVPPEETRDSVMFSAQSIFIRPELFPLLKREIHLSTVSFSNSALILRQDKNGANWQRLPVFKEKKVTETEQQKPQGGWNFSIVQLPAIRTDNFELTDYSGNKILISSAELSGKNARIDFVVKIVTTSDNSGAEAKLVFPGPYDTTNLKNLVAAIRQRKLTADGSLSFRRFSHPLLPAGLSYLDGKIKFTGKEEQLQFALSDFTLRHRKLPVAVTYNGQLIVTGKAIHGSNSELQAGQNIRLSQLSFAYEDTLQNLQGNLEADLATIATLLGRKSGISGKVSGKINIQKGVPAADLVFQNLSYAAGELKFLENVGFSARIQGSRFEVPSTEITVFGQPLRLAITGARNNNRWNLTYEVQADTLYLPELLQRLRPQAAGQQPQQSGEAGATGSELPQVYIQGKVHFAKLKFEPVELQDVEANTDLEPSQLSLKNLRAGFSGGQITGWYQFALKSALHEFSLNAAGIKPNVFFEAAGIKARWFTTLNGTLTGSMQGRSSAEFRPSLKARLRLESSGGRLVNSAMQRGFITGVLGPLEDRLSAIEYRRAALELSAADNQLYIRQATFDSDDLALKLMGSADWNWQGDVVAELRFKDSFIRDVANPLQLGIEDVRRGDWYVLPFSCQGKINESRCWQKEW